MEGEKDDIQFYFGRAFRALKRAEGDMTRKIVDTVTPPSSQKTDVADDDVLSPLSFPIRHPQFNHDHLRPKTKRLASPHKTIRPTRRCDPRKTRPNRRRHR